MNSVSTSSADKIIDYVVKMNKIHRFACQLEYQTDKKTIDNIKRVISILDYLNRETCDNPKNIKRDKINNAINNEHMKNIYDEFDDITMHWKWPKLTIPQQKNRISEYIRTTISDTRKATDAIKLVNELIDSKNLKKNAVTYDTKKGQVTGIFISKYQDIINNDTDSENTE